MFEHEEMAETYRAITITFFTLVIGIAVLVGGALLAIASVDYGTLLNAAMTCGGWLK